MKCLDCEHDLLGECTLFASQKSALLLQPATGATLLASPELGARIVRGDREPELLRVLSLRGFALGNERIAAGIKTVDPRFFMIDLTRACNNRCTYCFRKLHRTERIDETMLDGIVAKIVAHCRACGLQRITLQAWGGEPLLAWNSICRMQDALHDAEIEVRMLIETNGVCVTPALAREMYARGILCSVSIDGPAFVHDRNRLSAGGGGSYAAALRGFERLREAGYGRKVGAVCVVTQETLSRLPEIVGYFASELGLPRVKMNVVKESAQMSDKSLCLTLDDTARFWRALLCELEAVNRQGISFGESTVIAMLHNLTTHRPVSFCHSQGCQSGYRMLSFGMDGGIYPCDLTDCPELRLGDIRSAEGLTAMVARQASSHPFLRMSLPAACADCPWRTFCGGGCTSMRLYHGAGEPDGADCVRNRTLYPLLAELILDKPHIVSSLTGAEVKIT